MTRWDLPTVVAVALGVCLAATILWAGSTSVAAFSAYNSEWNGTSELRGQAGAVGAEATVVTDTEQYGDVPPSGTVAVVLSPDDPYTDAETERLREFVRRGGTLVIAEDFGPNGNALLDGVGASTRVDGRLVRDERYNLRSPNLVVATEVNQSALTGGADQLTLNYGSVLEPNGARVVVRTSSFAYVDENGNGELDDEESLEHQSVVTTERIGDGRAIIISDPSVFINGMLEEEGNARLTRGVFSGHERVLLDYSHVGETPPFVQAVLTLRRSPLVQGTVGFAALGVILVVSARHSTGRSRHGRTDSGPRASRERLRRGLANRRPDWDSGRLDRVIQGIMTDESERRNDD
jgi:hypothetical protein